MVDWVVNRCHRLLFLFLNVGCVKKVLQLLIFGYDLILGY
jgi:hypothetical protein